MFIKGSHTTKTDFTTEFIKQLIKIESIKSVTLSEIVNKRSSQRFSSNYVRIKLMILNDKQIKATLSHNKLLQVIYINTTDSVGSKMMIENNIEDFEFK